MADGAHGGPGRGRRWPYLVSAVVVLLVGALVAFVVGGALGIESHPSNVPDEGWTAEPAGRAVAPPHLTRIELPTLASVTQQPVATRTSPAPRRCVRRSVRSGAMRTRWG
jgi:hypothetical protein